MKTQRKFPRNQNYAVKFSIKLNKVSKLKWSLHIVFKLLNAPLIMWRKQSVFERTCTSSGTFSRYVNPSMYKNSKQWNSLGVKLWIVLWIERKWFYSDWEERDMNVPQITDTVQSKLGSNVTAVIVSFLFLMCIYASVFIDWITDHFQFWIK